MSILLLLVLWPLIEIAGFAWIGGMIGVGPTLGFVLVSGLLGLALLREAGLATLMRLRASLEAGKTPVPVALDGAGRILGGLLLVVPGFFSSAIGGLLLIPPLLLTGLIARRLQEGGSIRVVGFGTVVQPDPTVIEGEFRELPPERPELSPRR
ncbi:MAG: FxsA family protein [Aliidongia sp.]